jgi:hypothetical protein
MFSLELFSQNLNPLVSACWLNEAYFLVMCVNIAQGRTSTEKAVPIIPAATAKIKYSVPISLAFVDFNQIILYHKFLSKISIYSIYKFSPPLVASLSTFVPVHLNQSRVLLCAPFASLALSFLFLVNKNKNLRKNFNLFLVTFV